MPSILDPILDESCSDFPPRHPSSGAWKSPRHLWSHTSPQKQKDRPQKLVQKLDYSLLFRIYMFYIVLLHDGVLMHFYTFLPKAPFILLSFKNTLPKLHLEQLHDNFLSKASQRIHLKNVSHHKPSIEKLCLVNNVQGFRYLKFL